MKWYLKEGIYQGKDKIIGRWKFIFKQFCSLQGVKISYNILNSSSPIGLFYT